MKKMKKRKDIVQVNGYGRQISTCQLNLISMIMIVHMTVGGEEGSIELWYDARTI